MVTSGAAARPVAFVLGGGGHLGSAEVGMLRALLTNGVEPDIVVGTSVAIHFPYYHFCRAYGSLRVTPCDEALLSDHVWSIEEMIGLLDRRSAEAA